MKNENIEGYQKDGNILQFMKWFSVNYDRINNFFKNKEQNLNSMTKIHVVAHSKIMREYLKMLVNFKVKLIKNNRNNTTNTTKNTKVINYNSNISNNSSNKQSEISRNNSIIQIISKTNCGIIETSIDLTNTIVTPGYYPDSYKETLNSYEKILNNKNIKLEKGGELCGRQGKTEVACKLSKKCSLRK